MRRGWLLALSLNGCATSFVGSAGLTMDTTGHVGVMVKLNGSSGFEVSKHAAGQQTHGSASFLDFDVSGVYDLSGKRFGGFFDTRAGGTAIWDRSRFGLTPSAGIRVGGFTGGRDTFVVGPVVGFSALHTIRHTEGNGCQPGDAPHSHHLVGATLDGSWLWNREHDSFGLFFLGAAYQYHGTFAFCFSERNDTSGPPAK